MPQGLAVFYKTATNGPYAYTWKDDAGQEDVDTVVVNKTLAQAFSEIGTLATAMAGTIRHAEISVITG